MKPLMTPEKIRGVRDVTYDDHTARLNVYQTVSGSAYMKVYGWVIRVFYAGFDKVILVINEDHPYLEEIRVIAKELQGILPDTFEIELHVGIDL